MENMKQVCKDIRKHGKSFGKYKDEKVRIDDYDKFGSLYIFIPSRQEPVWVTSDKVDLI